MEKELYKRTEYEIDQVTAQRREESGEKCTYELRDPV